MTASQFLSSLAEAFGRRHQPTAFDRPPLTPSILQKELAYLIWQTETCDASSGQILDTIGIKVKDSSFSFSYKGRVEIVDITEKELRLPLDYISSEYLQKLAWKLVAADIPLSTLTYWAV